MIKFENFILFKRFSDVLDRIFVFGKFMILDGLLSLKLCFVSMELMLVVFYKIFNCCSEMRVYFGLFIDISRVIVFN